MSQEMLKIPILDMSLKTIDEYSRITQGPMSLVLGLNNIQATRLNII